MRVTFEQIKSWCSPLLPQAPYFRPFVCKGDLERVDTFLVGLNPATPIGAAVEPSLEAYAKSLSDERAFKVMYAKARGGEAGRTRQGINSLVRWMGVNFGAVVAQTNVICFPTPRSSLIMSDVYERERKRGREIFWELFLSVCPKTIIIHGSKAKSEFVSLLRERNVQLHSERTWEAASVKELEEAGCHIAIPYANGESATAWICRNLMYYGESGNSFAEFRKNILKVHR